MKLSISYFNFNVHFNYLVNSLLLVLLNSSYTLVPLSFIEAMTLYSGAFVLVDTSTSTGIHYIEMVTLYSGMFVLVEILILIPVHSWHPVLLLIVC